MGKKLLLIAVLALAVPAVWLGAGGNSVGSDYDFGFGKQIAGGWIATLTFAPGASVDVLVSLTADGGGIASGQLRPAGEDGTGAWMGTRYNTTSHGSWKRNVHNELEFMILLQVQNNDGGLVFYEKVLMEAVVNPAATRMEGTGLYQLIKAGDDPLDPRAPIFAQGGYTVVFRKIR
jgi:hypothetical protein